MPERWRAIAPGRVNLIGDHTDYTGGLVFPMAIDRETVIDFEHSNTMTLTSADVEGGDWLRYVEAVRALVPGARAVSGRVSTTIPVGAGLSSSAALEVAVALALGFSGSPEELAALCRQAEHDATGVPCGIMDQLCIAAAREGCATLIDCRSLEVRHVPILDSVKVVVRFVASRTLEGSGYAMRVRECAAAEAVVGPLRDAALRDLATIEDERVRRRAVHVVSENARVRSFAAAMESFDYALAGEIMLEGHRSLAENYDVSTPAMDRAVRELAETPGVYGARMTGGGFGGCVVALCEPDARVDGWVVRAAGRARLERV
ncbi:MAG: galactokinase [Actinobacteria bacterium]|nr:galactokinase [Actinomycetota bacterium]